MSPEAMLDVAGDLSAIGFVLWLAHRLTVKTIPDMTQRFIAAIETQRADFREAMKEQSASHEARLQTVMDKCIRAMPTERPPA